MKAQRLLKISLHEVLIIPTSPAMSNSVTDIREHVHPGHETTSGRQMVRETLDITKEELVQMYCYENLSDADISKK